MKQSIIITGASGNMGAAVAERLMSEGYHIIGTVHSESSANALNEKGIEAKPLDLTNEEAVSQFVNELDKDITGAVLTVGGFAVGGFEDTDGTAVKKMYTLNFETAYFMVRPLLKVFEKRGGGQIILVGSRPALNPEEGKNLISYALSKRLVFYLAELINAYGKDKNIQATVLVPGIIDTPRNRQDMPDADYSKWVSLDAIADSVRFIFSDAGKQMKEGVIKLYNRS